MCDISLSFIISSFTSNIQLIDHAEYRNEHVTINAAIGSALA